MSRSARHAVNISQTARRLAAATQLWHPLVDFDPVSRYYARLVAERDHEAWLLTWLPGQGTPWHDHGSSAGSFIVLQGVLSESVAQPHADGPVARSRATALDAGDQRSFGRRYVHRVANNGLDPAVSLHVYSPALTEMNEYVERPGQPDVLDLVAATREGVHW